MKDWHHKVIGHLITCERCLDRNEDIYSTIDIYGQTKEEVKAKMQDYLASGKKYEDAWADFYGLTPLAISEHLI